MIPLIRRHAAQLAILAVAGLAAPTAVIAQQDAQKAAPRLKRPHRRRRRLLRLPQPRRRCRR